MFDGNPGMLIPFKSGPGYFIGDCLDAERTVELTARHILYLTGAEMPPKGVLAVSMTSSAQALKLIPASIEHVEGRA
jgi:hypothetical protein